MLLQKQGTDNGIECSLHHLPRPLLREFRHVFQDEYLNQPRRLDGKVNPREELLLLAIPTNQRAREDLVAIGDHIEEEKDRLLNVVSFMMLRICFSSLLFQEAFDKDHQACFLFAILFK